MEEIHEEEEENFSSPSSSLTPLSVLSSPPHLLSDTENDDKKCIVCKDFYLSQNEAERQICFYCEEFFKHSMKICADYDCKESPICQAMVFNVRNCDYCRMEKCFFLGMKDLISCDIDVSLREQKKMGTSEFNAVKNDHEEIWVRALLSFNRYLTLIQKWLSVFPEYQRLSEEDKVILKERYRLRGVIIHLIERSLYYHQVLKFDGFYWNPWNYSMNDITILLANILSIILHLEDQHVTLDSFNILKLKLVLRNNVRMRDIPIDGAFLQLLEEKIDETESRLLAILNERGNVIEESAASYEDFYYYEPSPPDDNFPEHRIQVEL